MQSGGLPNASLGDKKRHTRVCRWSEVGGWACKTIPEAPVLFNTRALNTLHCHGRVSDGA